MREQRQDLKNKTEDIIEKLNEKGKTVDVRKKEKIAQIETVKEI